MNATTETTETQGTNGSDRFALPGDTPVVEFAGRLVAIHDTTTSKGAKLVSISEVRPAKMSGRTVERWTTTFGGLRLSFRSRVDAATQLDALRRALAPAATGA